MKHTSLQIHDDELTVILEFLPEGCYANFSLTNKRFYSIVKETNYWKRYLSHKAEKIEKRIKFVKRILKLYPISLSIACLACIIICFIPLFFAGAASFVSEHVCQVSQCTASLSTYCTATRGRNTCYKWDIGLVVNMLVVERTRNATSRATDQFIKIWPSQNNQNSGCIVSQISKNSTNITTGQQIMWKDSLMLIEVNHQAEIPCFYNDRNDFFFERSFSVIRPRLDMSLFWFLFALIVIFVGLIVCVFTSLALCCIHICFFN